MGPQSGVSGEDEKTTPQFLQVDLGPMDGVFMPITLALTADLRVQAFRNTFIDPGGAAPLTSRRPLAHRTVVDGADECWTEYWEVCDFGAWVRGRALQAGVPPGAVLGFAAFFEAVFRRPPPAVVYMAQGAQFAASRAALRRTSNATYAWLLRRIEAGHVEVIYYLEATWLYLLLGVEGVERLQRVRPGGDPARAEPRLTHLFRGQPRCAGHSTTRRA